MTALTPRRRRSRVDPQHRLAERVRQAIARERLIPPGGRVLAAVSGGADSVALAALLAAAAPAGGFALAGLVHVNHQLRGRAADEDEAFCRALAARLGVPAVVERADVGARARAERVSVEHAGRRARYEAFERAAAAQGAAAVATGHTRDDQAETVLLRLLRGAGPAGLAGIRPRAGRVVRPLLDVPRRALREYLAARGLAHREDESNRDLRAPRNRVRHRLLPLLAREFSPAVVEALARGAAIARADADWMDGVARERAAAVVTPRAADEAGDEAVGAEGGALALDAAALGAEPPALARRIARAALERAAGRGVEFAHVERLLALALAKTPGAEVDFPGCRVERRGAQLVLRPAAPGRGRRRAAAAEESPAFEHRLDVPGEVEVPEAGLAISAARAAEAPERLRARGSEVAVAAGRLTPPLTVRSRRPGDAFRPLGLGGRKKLQDFFVDRKVARAARATAPVVTDARGAIVWVVGHGLAEDFRVTDRSAAVLRLRSRKLGGHG